MYKVNIKEKPSIKCLILGGAGFIGSHIVDALLLSGYKVRVFDRANCAKVNLRNVLSKIEFYGGDLFNERDIATAIKDIDVVIHLISATIPASSNSNPIYDVNANVIGTLRLLEIAKSAGVKKIIFSSSGGTVYGNPMQLPIPENHSTNPISSYGISKLAIEKYLMLFHHLYGLDYVILRIANPYGERQDPESGLGAVTTFIWKALKDETISVWGNGDVSRDYFYVSDLATAFIAAIETSTESKIFNIGSGKYFSLNDVLKTINSVTGINVKVNYLDPRKLDIPINCLDINLAKSELMWEPLISLEEGIGLTYAAMTRGLR